MKKLLLSSVALFGLSTAALAADLPRRQYVAPAPVPVVAVPVFTWTGFYVGVNAGGAFADNNRDNVGNCGFFGDCFGGSGLSVPSGLGGLAPVVPLSGFNTFGTGFFNDRNGRSAFAGGGQIGYNYQFTPGSGWVIGIEADIQGTTFNNNRNNNDFFGLTGFGTGTNGIFTAAQVPNGIPGTGILAPTGVGNGALGNVALFNGGGAGLNAVNNFRNRLDWFGTVRGRLGYAWDRLLIYATGGGVFVDNNNNNDNTFFGFGNGITSGASLVGTGFYAGTGATLAARQAAGAAVAPGTTFGLFNDRNNNNNWGWTVGGGLEYAFTNNWTAKIEGLYVDTGEGHQTRTFTNVTGVVLPVGNYTATTNGSGGGGVVRVGVNYKF